MNNGVVVRNTAEIIRRIDSLSAAMTGPAITKGMRAGALHVRELARANLAPHVDTGALWDSLRVTAYSAAKRGKAYAVLKTSGRTYTYEGKRARRKGSTMPGLYKVQPYYGIFLEFGTVKMQGIHWMERAGQAGGPRTIDHVRASLAATLAAMRPVTK